MQRSRLPEANGLNALGADFCLLMEVLKRNWVFLLCGWGFLCCVVVFFSDIYILKFAINYIPHSINSWNILHRIRRVRASGKEVWSSVLVKLRFI